MIYCFRIVSDEVDDFRLEIQIDSNATFLDLRNAICDAVKYEKNEMSSFFMCEDGWEKGAEITLEDMGSDMSSDIWIMEDTPLSDLIEEEGQRLMWVYDYMTERAFFIEMNEILTGKNLNAPVCTLLKGKAPEQFADIDVFDDPVPTKGNAAAVVDDMDEDFYGDTSYNDDEFDAESFGEFNEM